MELLSSRYSRWNLFAAEDLDAVSKGKDRCKNGGTAVSSYRTSFDLKFLNKSTDERFRRDNIKRNRYNMKVATFTHLLCCLLTFGVFTPSWLISLVILLALIADSNMKRI